MIVSELIAALQTLDPNLPVVVRGYEDGVNDIQELRAIHIMRNTRKGIDYCGMHDYAIGQAGEQVIELWGDNPEDETVKKVHHRQSRKWS